MRNVWPEQSGLQDPRRHGSGDGLSDLAIHPGAIFGGRLEPLGPQVRLVLHANQMSGNAQPPINLLHLPKDNVPDIERRADGCQIPALPCLTEHGGIADYREPIGICGQARDRCVSQGLRQPIVIGIPSLVIEGHHRQTQRRAAGGRMPAGHQRPDDRGCHCDRDRANQHSTQGPAAEGAGGGRSRVSDRGDKPVPAPGQRLDEARLRGGIAQRRPDLRDAVVQSVLEIDERFASPDPLLQLGARHNVAGTLDENGQNTRGLRFEPYARGSTAHFSRNGVKLELAEPDHPGAHQLTSAEW
jgi:hypothetical protein